MNDPCARLVSFFPGIVFTGHVGGAAGTYWRTRTPTGKEFGPSEAVATQTVISVSLEIPGYLGGLRDHARSGIPVPILAGATAATYVLETSCNILPYVRLNYPYQHTSNYASTRYL